MLATESTMGATVKLACRLVPDLRRLGEQPPRIGVFGGFRQDETGRAHVPADVLESLCRDRKVGVLVRLSYS